MVVVLSPIVQAPDALNANQALADKEPIMASLNLKAMPFDDVATVLQREMVAHLSTDDSGTKVSQPNRILSVSKLEEISAVLPMITELGKNKHGIRSSYTCLSFCGAAKASAFYYQYKPLTLAVDACHSSSNDTSNLFI